MKDNLISVMVPCYNTEKYLKNCIESIINQTYKNIEVIIVNDGSTDNSLEIMNEYASIDSRIHVIDRKENKGVSYSRNEALSVAKGKYLTFVDSDDTIALDYCEKLLNALVETNSDIAMCHIYRLYEGEIACPSNNSGKQVCSRNELLYNLILRAEHLDVACAKLYTRKALKDIVYPVDRVYEDTATTYKIFSNVDKAVELYDEMYFYTLKRAGSIIGDKYTLKKLKDNYLAISERYNYLINYMVGFEELAKLGYIRNIITLLDRVYLSDEIELINSDICESLISDLKEIYPVASKYASFNELVNSYKRCCIYFLLNDRVKDYSDMIHFVYNKNNNEY